MTECIDQADIERSLADHTGARTFSTVLEGIGDSRDMLRVLGRYIFINAPFAGGVANLAGELAVRYDLFRDPDEPIAGIADRSSRVAASIFYACIDEFHDSSAPRRDTHRSLAQATLKGMGQYFGYDDATLNALLQPTQALLSDIRDVRDGYGVNQPMEEERLIRAIGFHIGSEILADEEFRILDSFLRARHPELVAYLESSEATIGGIAHPAYIWIKIHTSVEADHFAYALRGANDTLRYYAGTRSAEQVKERIFAGLREFAAVQARFMQHLSAD